MTQMRISTGVQVFYQSFGGNLQGLDRTELLGVVAALSQVAYQCEYSEDWTLEDELFGGKYDELSSQVKTAIMAFDGDDCDQADAIGFCTAILLKLVMKGS